MQQWIRDFRHAARSPARAPGFTFVVVATLALAIGANATIFSVVNAVLLEPLPYPLADRLVHIGGTAPGTDIGEVIPTSPMYRIFTMKRLAAKAMADLSFTMLMVSLAALLALVLGAVGLYGVLSYRVTRRAREIGVRIALGAEAKTVRRMFVCEGGRVALAGIVAGTLASVGLSTYIQALLFGVGRLDVPAFAGMAAVMLAVALLASYIPARRASRVDPVVALRAE